MRKAILTLVAIVVVAPSVLAIPGIQLWSPEGTYNPVTETWEITTGEFDLYVIVDDKFGPYTDLTVVAALSQEDTPVDGALTMGGTTFNSADFQGPGNPGLSPHGVYTNPGTYYALFEVTPLTAGPTVPISDVQPGETGTGTGWVYQIHVTTTYGFVHFDAFGYNSRGQFKNAPFSHDVAVVPEPTTAILIGLGLVGTAIVRRRLRK
jgi:hypothetical protein